MSTEAVDGVGFEPFAPTWRAEPLEMFEKLRDRAPVYVTPTGMYVLSRYESVRDALANPKVFSSECVDHEALGMPRHIDESTDPELVEMLETAFHGMPVGREELSTARTVIGSDAPEHERQRRLINRAFSARRVRDLRGQMEEIVAESLADIDQVERYEVMERFASVLPQRIIGELLSVERQWQPDLTRWTHEMMNATGGPNRHTSESRQRLLDVLGEYIRFFVPRIDEKRANPTDDFISDLVRAEEADSLTAVETLMLMRLMMIAGTDTTAALIGNTVLSLLRNPEQQQLLSEQPELVPSAIEESLRYWAPFYFLLRNTTEAIEVEGVTIPQGALVAIMIGAANHDEREFDDPVEFDIRRPLRHLSFGYGAHFCVGAHLARAEAQVAIEAILPHLSRFELADEPLELAENQFLQSFMKITMVAKASP